MLLVVQQCEHGVALELAVHLNAIVLWSFALFGMSLVLYGVVRATGAVVPPLIMLALALCCVIAVALGVVLAMAVKELRAILRHLA